MTDSYSVYTHKVVTDEGKELFYVGVTKQIKKRWIKSQYKNSSLYPYIQQYGWDNIEHSVVKKDLCKDDAYDLEDELIKDFKLKGCCINKKRSGYCTKDSEYNRNYRKLYYDNNKTKRKKYKYKYSDEQLAHYREINKAYYYSNRESILERQRQYNTGRKDEIKERNKKYYQEHKEELKAKAREYRKNKKLKTK